MKKDYGILSPLNILVLIVLILTIAFCEIKDRRNNIVVPPPSGVLK